MKLLQLNLMQCSLYESWRKRQDKVASLVIRRGVDVLTLQEGAGGLVQTSFSTIGHLAGLLDYDYSEASCFGAPGFLTFRVGIISRLPLLNVERIKLPHQNSDWSFPYWWKARAIKAQAGSFGPTIASTHFSSPIGDNGRVGQALTLAGALRGKEPLILGGDFNSMDARIGDTFAIGAFLKDAWTGPGGETFGLPGNPNNPDCKSGPSRIDRVYFRGLPFKAATVVFTGPNTVSDHAGVLVEFGEK
jgi:endonuclease/exonuclease/phosphatase family metal-dependent hydrolase